MDAKNNTDDITIHSSSSSSSSSSEDDERGRNENLQLYTSNVREGVPRVYQRKAQKNQIPLSFSCPLCNDTFLSKDDMLRHMNEHKKDIFSENKNDQAWKDHSSKLKYGLCVTPMPVTARAKTLAKKTLLCEICLTVFSTKEEMTAHIIQHAFEDHEKHPTECNKRLPKSPSVSVQWPNATAQSSSGIVTMMVSDDDKKKNHHVCPTCFKVFPTQHKMAEHAVSHVIQEYMCSRCSSTFHSKAEWTTHMAQHPRTLMAGSFKCQNCGKKCFNFTMLKAHVRFCVNQYVKICSACHAILENNIQFKMHVMKHVQAGVIHQYTDAYITYCCSHCDWDFWCRDELRGHQIIRTSDVSFKCSLCRARFCLRPHLDEHMTWHNRIQPFKCKYCPTECFENKSLLDEHLSEDHDPLRPYNCPHCDKCFFLPSTLQLHVKGHSKSEDGVQGKMRPTKLSSASPGSHNENPSCQNVGLIEEQPDLLKLVQETIQIAESNTANPSALPPELGFLAQALDGSGKSSDPGLGLIPRRVPVSLKPAKSVIRIQVPSTRNKSKPITTPTLPTTSTSVRQTEPTVGQTEEVIIPDPISPPASRSPSPPTIRAPFLTRTYSKASNANRTYSKTPPTHTTELCKSSSTIALPSDNVSIGADSPEPTPHPKVKEVLGKSPTPSAKLSHPNVRARRQLPNAEPSHALGQQNEPDEVAALATKFGALIFMAVGQETSRRLQHFQRNITALIHQMLVASGAYSSSVNGRMSHGALSLDIYSVMKVFLPENHVNDPLFTPSSIETLLAEMLWILTQNPEMLCLL